MVQVNKLSGLPNFSQEEKRILDFWQKNSIFQQSIDRRSVDKSFVFYDGPPFATGLPHYGHLVASTTKDVIPRFWTMKGYRVERVWGWDCHGLPIENLLEKELNLPDKRAIEDYGIDNFNEACRSKVLTYADDWEKIIDRIGRWVDMKNDYKTMENWYMESLWWVFYQLWQRKLIYFGHKSMHICPRCATALSNFEVTQGYKEIKDISVIVKFPVNNAKELFSNSSVYLLAWTTTPWTLPANIAIAFNHQAEYCLVEVDDDHSSYIVAKERINWVFGDRHYQVRNIPTAVLSKISYKPVFPYFFKQFSKVGFKVVAGEFVTLEEGTGLVHVAPGFGEEDYNLAKELGLPMIQHVSFDGRFTDQLGEFAHLPVKPKDDHLQTDIKLIKYLESKNLLFRKINIKHAYPHCWRCDTPLLNYATDSWFVKVTSFKDQLLKNNKAINWVPNHIQDGRFGTWLNNVRDWAISRNRYWGTPLPIWRSEDGETICISSIAELEKLAGTKVVDLHKHYVDKITFYRNGKLFKRVPEVLDCWFESGAMPYASFHYPFKNKEKFERNFPAEFISEGQDQTRGWFYTLHVLATALTMGKHPAIPVSKSSSAFKNVIVNGVVLAEDGKKMSKRLKNYPDPMEVVEKYGVDSLRLYLMSSAVMKAENLNFSEKDVASIRRKVFVIWWNILSFYLQYKTEHNIQVETISQPKHILDRWLLAKLAHLIKQVTKSLDSYDVVSASRSLIVFINDFSNWYLRLSRERIKKHDLLAERTFGYALNQLAKLYAPFTPFFSELVYQKIHQKEDSIHLTDWPIVNQSDINNQLLEEMDEIRKLVELGHASRSAQKVKIKQPLASVKVSTIKKLDYQDLLTDLIKQELNVKQVEWSISNERSVEFDFVITETLIKEGEARELMRQIQQLRQEQKLSPTQSVTVEANYWPSKWQSVIEQKTNCRLVLGRSLRILIVD